MCEPSEPVLPSANIEGEQRQDPTSTGFIKRNVEEKGAPQQQQQQLLTPRGLFKDYTSDHASDEPTENATSNNHEEDA